MKIIAGVLIAAALAFGSGCASTDWIDRTLVTVDVTGTWSASMERSGGRDLLFELEQQGSTVKGFMRLPAGGSSIQSASASRINPGPLDGTVAGDVFRFRLTNSGLVGELKVSGDEMSGQVSWLSTGPISLRRVDSTSQPGSPPR
jgi:hypothetical protein